MALSIADLNLTARCESPMPLELVDTKGDKIGVTVHVLGGHAKQVKDFVAQNINAARAKAAMSARTGQRKLDYTPVEQDIEFGVESIAIRVVSWDGLADECTFESAKLLCQINPDIRRQILEFSEDMGNFTRG